MQKDLKTITIKKSLKEKSCCGDIKKLLATAYTVKPVEDDHFLDYLTLSSWSLIKHHKMTASQCGHSEQDFVFSPRENEYVNKSLHE